MAEPEAGVALATKFTGEATVAPFDGEHTTTPGDAGAEQPGVVVLPVPVNETVCGLPEAESVIVIAPVRVPDCDGAKVTLMMQLAPALSVDVQLFVCAKSPLAVMPDKVNVEPPLLLKVTDCAALVVPTCWLPKVRLPGFRLTTAPAPELVTVIVDPAIYKAPLSSHTCVRITCAPGATVTLVFTVFEFDACLKTTTSST
jgi:hypothetical protein